MSVDIAVRFRYDAGGLTATADLASWIDRTEQADILKALEFAVRQLPMNCDPVELSRLDKAIDLLRERALAILPPVLLGMKG